MLGAAIGDKANAGSGWDICRSTRGFPEYLKGGEVIRYVAGLTGISECGCSAKAKTGELIGDGRHAGLGESHAWGPTPKGMKQRIGLSPGTGE